MDGYELIDSGHGRKLERFGQYVLARPCAQAVWKPILDNSVWSHADASFDRENGNRWNNRGALPESWIIDVDGSKFNLSDTDFGHLGIFPEQRAQWQRIYSLVKDAGREISVLNLFAYSGGSTLAAARGGAEVCHLDASKGMVEWARENAKINNLEANPIRWIVDDAHKFLLRELKRGRKYDGIILDPPTFGRGQHGELYKIEEDLPDTLAMCARLLSDNPLFMLLSAHTPGFSPQVLSNILGQTVQNAKIIAGEMLLTGANSVPPLPSGAFARAEF